jgi:hypothetical protein
MLDGLYAHLDAELSLNKTMLQTLLKMLTELIESNCTSVILVRS